MGNYEIREIRRDTRFYHKLEYSDGYIYRLSDLDRENLMFDKRISVGQNDLYNAIEGFEEEETREN